MKIPLRLSAFVGIFLVVAWGMGTLEAQPADDRVFVSVELSTVGLDGRTGVPVVLLRDPESGSVLPIWVGAAEAQAIALALHGVIVPRPMTHDLMASLLSTLRADVDEVIVTISSTTRISAPFGFALRATTRFATSTAVRATPWRSRCEPVRRFVSRARY